MSYKNCSFLAFFQPLGNFFSSRGVLTHLNSKFSWQKNGFRLTDEHQNDDRFSPGFVQINSDSFGFSGFFSYICISKNEGTEKIRRKHGEQGTTYRELFWHPETGLLRLTFMNNPNPYEHRNLFSTTNSTNSTNYNDIATAISIFAWFSLFRMFSHSHSIA